MNFWIIHLQIREIPFKPVSNLFEDDKLVRVILLFKRVSDAEFERHVETRWSSDV